MNEYSWEHNYMVFANRVSSVELWFLSDFQAGAAAAGTDLHTL